MARNEGGAHRQFGRGKTECLARFVFVHTFHFIQHGAGLYRCHPEFRVTLAAAHAHLERLFADRLVRENADPHAPTTLDEARQRAARRLDLARSNAAAGGGLEAEFTEADLVATRGHATVVALHLLAVLGAFWLQHDSLSPILQAIAFLAVSGSARADSPVLNTSPLKIHTFTPILP